MLYYGIIITKYIDSRSVNWNTRITCNYATNFLSCENTYKAKFATSAKNVVLRRRHICKYIMTLHQHKTKNKIM